jgi:hypothetical protein
MIDTTFLMSTCPSRSKFFSVSEEAARAVDAAGHKADTVERFLYFALILNHPATQSPV